MNQAWEEQGGARDDSGCRSGAEGGGAGFSRSLSPAALSGDSSQTHGAPGKIAASSPEAPASSATASSQAIANRNRGTNSR